MRYEMETSGPKDWWKSERIKTGKVKQDDATKNRTEFHLRDQGIGDECGLVPKSVWRGEEFFDGEIWLSVGGKENVGDIMELHEFHNITLLIRLIHQIRKCHRLNQFLCWGGQGGRGSPRGCALGQWCYIQSRCIVGSRV